MRIIWFLMISVGAALTFFWALVYFGFCFATGRFVRDDELIQAAINYEISMRAVITRGDIPVPDPASCCVVYRGGWATDPVGEAVFVLLGRRLHTVVLSYPVSRSSNWETRTVLDSCGNVLDWKSIEVPFTATGR